MKLPLLLAIVALGAAGCRPAANGTAAAPAQPTPEDELRERLNPIHQTSATRMALSATPVGPEPFTIFPVPIRSWLPPAVMTDQPRALPAQGKAASLPQVSSSEVPPLAPIASPERTPLATPPLAQVSGPDASRFTTWIVSNPAPGARSSTVGFEVPTDPATEAAIPPAKGLRETPPPFLRLSIPDPFEQLTTAELRNPPPESEAPFFAVPRPVVSLPESTIIAAGK